MVISKNNKNSNIFRNTRNSKNNRMTHMYGGGPVSSQEFDSDFPRGIAIHNSGYVFVACAKNNHIRIFLPDPDYTHIYTIGTTGINGNTKYTFNYPIGLVIDNDILYVADSYNHRIQVFRITINDDNTITLLHLAHDQDSPHSIGTGVVGNTHETFNHPTGIAIDNDILYIADTRNNRIQMFRININNSDNTITTIHLPCEPGSHHSIGTGQRGNNSNTFYKPTGIAIHMYNDNNILYVIDSGNNRIQIFKITTNDDNTITALHLPSIYGNTNSLVRSDLLITDAYGIAIYNNMLYIADTFNKRIMVFNITINNDDNTITYEYLPAHTNESPANVHVFCQMSPWRNRFIPMDMRNRLFYPYEIAIHNNKLYVADSRNNRIQIFNGDLTNPTTLQYYNSFPPPPPDFKVLMTETHVPMNIRDRPCKLCLFPLCQRVIGTTNNANGYVVHLHNLTNPNTYYYHYKCIYRHFTQKMLSDNPYKSPHCATIIDRVDIATLLNIDKKLDAINGNGFY
jgi:DNA-binding beta-propeller fold protein YncE